MPVKKWLMAVFILLMVLNVAYVWSGVQTFGLSSIDATAIWMFKAKAFVVEGGIPWQTLLNPAFVYQHPQYPLGLPTVMAAWYWVTGSVNETAVLFWYPIMYAAILWLCYQVIQKLGAEPVVALGATYLYSFFSPLLAGAGRRHPGEADIVITLLAWVVLWLIQRMHQKPQSSVWESWAIVGIIMLASQIKMEGLFLLPFLWFLPTKRVTQLVQSGVAVLPFVVWSSVVRMQGLPADFGFAFPGFIPLLERFAVIVLGYGNEFLKVNQWYLFWPILALTLVLWPQKSRWIARDIIPPTLIMAVLFTLVYITTTLDTHAHLVSSIDRVLLQMSPWFFVIWIDRVIGRIQK